MVWSRKIILLIVLALSLGALLPVTAGENSEQEVRVKGLRWASPPGIIEADVFGSRSPLGLQRKVDLTADQLQEMRTLRRQQKRQKIDLRAELDKARLDLDQELESEDPYLPAIRNQVEELYEHKADLEIARIEFRKELRAILTGDQLEELPPGFIMRRRLPR